MKEQLKQALQNIKKQYGQEAIMELGSTEKLDVKVIPSGSLGVDIAIGAGGFPRGRIVEISGPESGGKTTLTLQLIAEAQKRGGICAFIDAEHALDPVYARNLGVDVDHLLVSQPNSGEEALEIAEALVRSASVDVIVVDSVAALVPKAELEGEFGTPQMGLQARLMSQAMRKLSAIVKKSDTCFVFINQIRMKLGVMYGSPETTSGGVALKFAASVRIDIRRAGTPTGEKGEQTGNPTRARIVKNKISPPFREAEFEIIYGEGICKEYELLSYGVERGLLEKSGSWYSYGGERLGQGKEGAREFLKKNPSIANTIEAKLRDLYFPSTK